MNSRTTILPKPTWLRQITCENGAQIGTPFGPPTPIPGISIENRKGIKIVGCTIRNFLFGINIVASSVELSGVSVIGNIANGIEATDSSRILITDTFNAKENAAFGINALNDVSITLLGATAECSGNGFGVQMGIRGSLFLDADANARKPASTLVASNNNLGFGVTITSNSHLFLFGTATIQTENNKSNGLTAFSISGIELDRNAKIVSSGNGLNGLLVEDSSVNMFTIDPTNVPTLILTDNGLDGLQIGKVGVFDTNAASITTITGNSRNGVFIDTNSIASFENAVIEDNQVSDVKITFGSQAEFNNNMIGSTIFCDSTTKALIRGDEPPCKKSFV